MLPSRSDKQTLPLCVLLMVTIYSHFQLSTSTFSPSSVAPLTHFCLPDGVFSDSASVFNSEDFNNGDTMTVEEMNEIAHMFRKKASCPPYLSQNVSTFMRVLTLPPEVRREIHELLRQEPDGGSMLASNLLTSSSISSLLPTTTGSSVSLEMVWCMQAPPNATQQGTLRTELGLPSGNPVNIPAIPNIGEPSFVHKDINQEIYFVVRFWITGQPYRFINIPLRYRYAPPQGLYLWTLLEKTEPTTAPTLNTTSHSKS
jgi:hypothetical protein